MKKFFPFVILATFFANIFSVSAATEIFIENPFKNQNNPYSYSYSNSQIGYQNQNVYSYDNRYGANYAYENRENNYRNSYNSQVYSQYIPSNYQNNNQYFFQPNPTLYNSQNNFQNNYNRNNYWNQYINPNYLSYDTASSRYPGCAKDDIIIGGQIWASCNASERRVGSDYYSGWFFAGDMYPTFYSSNGKNSSLQLQEKKFQAKSWFLGPCAVGYRLPTFSDWSIVNQYAKNNESTVARILNLPYNGWYMWYRDVWNIVSVDARLNIGGAYWTATPATEMPFVMHLDSTLAGYRTDGMDISNMDAQYRWQYADNSMKLIPGLYQELANVRCVKDI